MKYLLVIFIAIQSLAISAQEFHGGITAGLCGSQVDGDHYSGYDKAGLLGGFFVSYPISEKLIFNAELKYFQKGSRMHKAYDNGAVELYKMSLQYVEFPFWLSNKFKIKKYTLSFDFGLGGAYLMSSKEERDGYEIMYGNEFRKMEADGIWGFSYYINDHIVLSQKHHYSLFAIREFPGGINPKPQRIIFNKGQYNNIQSLSLYFLF